MNFKEAMDKVADGKTVKVTPNSSGEHPYLVKVGAFEDTEFDSLLCRSLTLDGTHLEPDCDWEPVCYLLCFEDYLDGEWEIVNEDDFKEEDE